MLNCCIELLNNIRHECGFRSWHASDLIGISVEYRSDNITEPGAIEAPAVDMSRLPILHAKSNQSCADRSLCREKEYNNISNLAR